MLPGLTGDEYKSLLQTVGRGGGARPLSPLEVGQLLNKSKHSGAQLPILAEALHLSGPTMISRFLRLLDLDPHVHHLVHWGQSSATVGFSAASELARLPRQEHEDAFQAVLEQGFSGSEVKSLVQQRLRSGRPLADCIADTARMRPQVVHYHVIIGAITSPSVRDALSALTQRDRDDLLASALGEISSDFRKMAGRLAADRFTLSYDDSMENKIAPLKQDLEQRVTKAIEHLLLSGLKG